jgi:hypothetical protein
MSEVRSASPFLIYALAFLNGAVLMAFEIIGSRILAPVFGNGIYVWGSLIGVFMAGMATGYFTGGALADRFRHPALLFASFAVSGLLLLSLPWYGSSLSLWIDGQDLDPRTATLFASLLLFFLPSAAMGAISPMLFVIGAGDLLRPGRRVGDLYAVSTLGSILGTLGGAFYLVTALGTRSTMWLLGSICLGLAIFSLALRGRGGCDAANQQRS